MSQRKAGNKESLGSTDLNTSKMVEQISIASSPQMVVKDTPEPEHGEVASCSNRSQKGSLVEKDEGQGPKAEKMSQRKARNNESPGSTDLSTSKMVEPISIASNPQMVVKDTPAPEHGEVASCSNRSQKGSLVEKDEGQGPKAGKRSQRKAGNNESPGSTDLSTSKMVEQIASSPQVLVSAGVATLILVNIVPHWDIYGRSQAPVRRYPNSGQYSPISVQ